MIILNGRTSTPPKCTVTADMFELLQELVETTSWDASSVRRLIRLLNDAQVEVEIYTADDCDQLVLDNVASVPFDRVWAQLSAEDGVPTDQVDTVFKSIKDDVTLVDLWKTVAARHKEGLPASSVEMEEAATIMATFASVPGFYAHMRTLLGLLPDEQRERLTKKLSLKRSP